MLQRLRERGLDLIISRSEYTAPELETRIILDEPLWVALPPAHPLAGSERVRLADLRHERFLLHRSPLGTGISDMVLRACQQAGFVPNVVYWGGETLPMLLMAQRGLGVAFAPQSFGQLAGPRAAAPAAAGGHAAAHPFECGLAAPAGADAGGGPGSGSDPGAVRGGA